MTIQKKTQNLKKNTKGNVANNMVDGKETNLRKKEYLNTYKCEWHVR